MSRKTNRDEAERVVRLPLAELRDELGERLRWGGKLTEESTLEHVAESVTLAVAIVGREWLYGGATLTAAQNAADRADSRTREMVADLHAAPWVYEWIGAAARAEFQRQREAWLHMTRSRERLEHLESIRRAAHPSEPVERTCQTVEDESRLDGRCACDSLPDSMKPCEVCRG